MSVRKAENSSEGAKRRFANMEQPLLRPERVLKRGRPSHDSMKHTAIEPTRLAGLPHCGAQLNPQVPRKSIRAHHKAARGASPTRTDGNTTFSHATLPDLQNFGALSGASEAIFSSDFSFPYPNDDEMEDFIRTAGLKSLENVCCDGECTEVSCPSCRSCELSCYLPCENPEECASEICQALSCAESPQPICMDHHTPPHDGPITDPINEQCGWVGNGENCTVPVHSPGFTLQHVTENHIKPQAEVTCQWNSCGISTDVHELSNHLWSDHEPASYDNASYVCLWYGCARAFSTHEELDEHFKMVHCHMGCHWAGCEMTTTSQTELQKHFSQQHLQLRAECGHNINSTGLLPKHCQPEPEFSASDASVSARNSGDTRPISDSSTIPGGNNEIIHTSEMAGQKACMWEEEQEGGPRCGRVFDDGNLLQAHIQSNHIRSLKCTELKCGWIDCKYVQSTKDKSKLARHAYKHSKYCFGACKVCHQEFSEKSKLQQHEATHLTVKPYACSTCEARFPTQNALTNHERIHNNDKPLICGMMVNGERCTYTCSDPSNMSTHKKKHLPPKFTCTICKKAFCRSDALKRHMITHDPQKMAVKKKGFSETG